MFEQMRELDTLGYRDIWVTEHHFNEYGGAISDPSTFLAAVAAQTQRIHLGIAIVTLPLHNPLQVAESYAMVDVISNGRLEFGLGRGSTRGEFANFGIGYDDSRQRMVESMEIITQAWSQEAVTFHGEIFDYDQVRLFPRPVQQPHPPIWVGASRSDDTFRWAGSQGYNLMTLPYMYKPEALREQIEIYKDALVEAGHDPATREILGKFHIYVAETNEAARREASAYLATYSEIANARNATNPNYGVERRPRDWDSQVDEGNVIGGDARRCIEIIEGWREKLGLTTISGTFYFGGMPQELALKNIRMFAAEVMPAFEPAAVRV
jgi:natural product biosynthesis luciferase-like monooxygenase protein